MTFLCPARSAMWRYRGTPFSAAPALQTASDTPRMALAPNLAVERETGRWDREIDREKDKSDRLTNRQKGPYICSQCRLTPTWTCQSSPARQRWSSRETNRQAGRHWVILMTIWFFDFDILIICWYLCNQPWGNVLVHVIHSLHGTCRGKKKLVYEACRCGWRDKMQRHICW